MATEVKTITITRIFDAPPELVWKAWTEPERVMEWWGPKGYSSPTCKIDLRIGGKYLFSMQADDGKIIWSSGTFQKIDPPKELVFTDNFADADGNVVPGGHYGFEEEFPEGRITVRFEDMGGKTKITLTHENMPATQSDGATVGWSQSLDKLAEALT
ncbi:MAG TPA: SRPBCC domain-containing protein [Anaerolineales bacterium]|jgi:uncharacterized protein YndB with AHSA1/START domain|nr:SRPBCC domain-containing protein [Anaerolineales bacterium]